MNMFRTGILIAGMTSVFLFCSFLVGGESGMIITFLIAIAINGFAYWNADKVVLRMYGAKEVNRGSAPAYYGIVEQLAINAELPMPQVYIVENDQPNAFATGRNPKKRGRCRHDRPSRALELGGDGWCDGARTRSC